jgi:SAM-dependent methyltransferase
MPNINQRGNAEVFKDIYANNKWEDPKAGEGGGSGGGSDPTYCKKYLAWLLPYLKTHGIKSVLDLGCGDFRIASHYYKEVEHYYGVDVVTRYPAGLRFNFKQADFSVPSNLEAIFEWCGPVDLVLVKDVLMHWTDDEIRLFTKTLVKLPWKRLITTNRWKYVRKPELNGTPRNPRGNKFSSSPLPHDHESLVLLPLKPVLYYPSRNSIQVCEAINPR